MKKVYTAVYIRVSTHEQLINGYDIDEQMKKLELFLELNDYNTEDVKYFIEEWTSQKDMKQPKIKELTHLIETGCVDCVVIQRFEQLTRNMVDLSNFLELITKHDCNLITVMDNLDIKTYEKTKGDY